MRRARGRLRRYCAHHRLNRLGTLTYAGKGCHDPAELREHIGPFFRQLRANLGGKPFPYVWVPEWHPGGHGLHVHFAVGRFIKRQAITGAWGRGFVHIKLIGDVPVGGGTLAEARIAARYLSKYVAKSFDDGQPAGMHRYEVAQGFQPARTRLVGACAQEVVGRAVALMGRDVERRWSSDEAIEWRGAPAVWLSWQG